MDSYALTVGEGRTAVSLSASRLGDGLVVTIYNEAAHIGAVAIGEYDHVSSRASVSVVTRTGHKDDTLAQQAAHDISKTTRKPVCVIAGVHLDDITDAEIARLVENSRLAVAGLLEQLAEK
jgi:hypothetical protein